MDSLRRDIIDLSRRGALRGALGWSALAAILPPTRPGLAQPKSNADPFTLGVASGDPWPDSVVLWTRLAPDPLQGGGLPNQAVAVGWELAEDEAFTRGLRSGNVIAFTELGHAAHVEVLGLAPDRLYFYRFHALGATSPVGRTRTAPAPDADPRRLRFVTAGCQHYEHGYFTAWDRIADEADLGFVFHYGDYIYEYSESAGNAVRRHQGDETYTQTEYRNRYALYKMDPDLRRAHAQHPFVMSYDDHEVDNNWAGTHSEEDGRGRHPIAVPPEIFALRKQIALRVWYESMPLRRGQFPRDSGLTAYRGLRWGRLGAVSVLDTRGYRDNQPCGDGTKRPCAEVANPNAQVLGTEQEAWLLRRLATPNATWSLLAQQVPMMPRDLGPNGGDIAMDKWDGYPAARERLLRQAHQARTPNLVVLTGDVHSAWVGTLHRDPRDTKSPVIGHEFVATSISSGGNGSETRPDTEAMLARNPHIAFYNSRRGYTVIEVTPTRLEARFRGLSGVTQPNGTINDRARFVIEANGGGLRRG
jgi:alkaline phosphatase D